MTNEMIGHFEEKIENKYLLLDDVDENKEVPKKYEESWEGIKKEIETWQKSSPWTRFLKN